MKHLFYSLLAALAVCVLAVSACASKPAGAAQPQSNRKMKSIIVYFTHSGNTELAARQLAVVTGSKTVGLQPVQPYSAEDVDWVNGQSRCTQEHLDQSLRPAIKPVDADLAAADTVFVGFPIWWHEEPAVIRTFLDNYREQLKGKVLFPFCTSYESPMSEADSTLRKGYPRTTGRRASAFPPNPSKSENG